MVCLSVFWGSTFKNFLIFSSELEDDLLGEDLLAGKKVRDVH